MRRESLRRKCLACEITSLNFSPLLASSDFYFSNSKADGALGPGIFVGSRSSRESFLFSWDTTGFLSAEYSTAISKMLLLRVEACKHD